MRGGGGGFRGLELEGKGVRVRVQVVACSFLKTGRGRVVRSFRDSVVARSGRAKGWTGKEGGREARVWALGRLIL